MRATGATSLDDFTVGDRFRHARGKTITPFECAGLAQLALNTSDGHFNEAGPGGAVVFGAVTLAIVVGLATEDTAETALAELSLRDVRLRRPVRVGDTLFTVTEVLAVDGGDVTFGHWGLNQHDDVVLECVRARPPPEGGAVTPPGPLAGLRVVDLTWMLAGPYATMLLADLGADVVKVEPPGGDPMRAVGPFRPDDRLRAFGGYFQSINRNKRSVVLDLKTEPGRAALLALAAGADVLVENFRAGVMDRLGLSYERLRAANPRLVYAAIRGFGDPRTGAGERAGRPAVDLTAQAMGGLMAVTGPAAGQPTKAGPGVGDLFPAVLCTVGILAAARHAAATGAGQLVDVAMYDGVVSLCERLVYQHSYAGEAPVPQGNSHPFFCPFDVFPARDGHVAVCASEDHQWAVLCEAMGRPELAADARMGDADGRRRHADEVRAVVAGWTAGRTADEVVAALAERVPAGRVQGAAELVADEGLRARGMLVDLEHPGCDGPVTVAGVPIALTETPGAVRRRAPLLGEHTDEVLAELVEEAAS